MHTYEISATNTPVSYHWTVSGNAILKNGQGTSQIQVEFTTPGTASVTVSASNECGQAINDNAANTITVRNDCPQPIAQIPATDQVVTKSVGTTVTFTTSFLNASNPSYQWYRDARPINEGGNITGTRTNSLTITSLTPGDANEYTCILINGCGTSSMIISKKFTLKVTGNPATMPLGNGTFTGRVCFDIAENQNGSECGDLNSRRSNRADFTNLSNADKTYTFTAKSSNVSNVRFMVVDYEGCVASTSNLNPVGGSLSNGSSTSLTVNYKTTLNSPYNYPSIHNRSRNQAAVVTLYAVYYDGAKDVAVPLTVKIQDCMCCGAKVSASEWKAFMCHNLGADESVDPFNPSLKLMGTYYQWGEKSPAAYAAHVSDTKTPAWNQYPAPNGGWIDNAKGPNDPCPNGWRVPTRAEWEGVKANNVFTAIGSWKPENNTSGYKAGPGLFLPASGVHSVSGFNVIQRGTYGIYWSSTATNNVDNAYCFTFSSPQSSISMAGYKRVTGINVRCISE
jgi:uncharacterized protein (TIGR02145 family)